jgi:hypothetical protein
MDKTLTFQTRAMTIPLRMTFTSPRYKQDLWWEGNQWTCQRYRWQKHD